MVLFTKSCSQVLNEFLQSDVIPVFDRAFYVFFMYFFNQVLLIAIFTLCFESLNEVGALDFQVFVTT